MSNKRKGKKLGKRDRTKQPKLDPQGRVICRTALPPALYMDLQKVCIARDRSAAYLMKQAIEEFIKSNLPTHD